MKGKVQGKGSCLCGAVQIETKAMDLQVGTCHCGMCRKWGGGPLMAVDCGTEVSFVGESNVTIYDSSEWAERGFCSRCGTHLFYRLKASMKHFMPVGLFAEEERFSFDHQIFIDRKPAFYSFANITNNLTEAEVFEKFKS